VHWYEDQKKVKKDDKNTVYLSTVWVHRKADFTMPVDVEIKLQ